MMDNKPIAVFIPAPLRYDEWKRRFALHWVDGEPIGITHLYSEDLVRQQQLKIDNLYENNARLDAEIDALKEVNTWQVDCISKQKEEYEKLWKEHMELFWKHEQDVEEEQEK